MNIECSFIDYVIESSNRYSRSSLKSMDSLYTSSSSKFSALNRRKVNQRGRNPSLVPAVSEIKQRVISARLLRMKQLQNQVGEAHHRIAVSVNEFIKSLAHHSQCFQELTAENRLLKSLHKRQDSALSKYESSSAELPKLLHSHSEEVRVWQTRCRNLQRHNKDLLAKIKQKDTIIMTVTDQNKHLLQLNKDKSLEEREKLAELCRDQEQRLREKDNDLKLLARRLQLETKAFKSNLHMEQQKYRDLVSKLELSDFMVQRSEIGEKKLPKTISMNHQTKSPGRPLASKSAISLTNGNHRDQHLTLPPCEGQEVIRKPNESIKTNSPRIQVNANVKHLPSSTTDDEDVDLTKNRVDKSDSNLKNGHINHDDDEITVTIRNGMNRARVPQKATKITEKLSPLHLKEIKQSSDVDSELSEDDFQLFSEHNGTKMVTMSPVLVKESKNVLGLYFNPFVWSFAWIFHCSLIRKLNFWTFLSRILLALVN